ncbi:olfactory receptor 6N1-like [Emydura macquarii macquarii]|uniref:olfactory receptor 6N1-like n=1 Tax=Emydura macquarii macquarii TaxID=1129001 RepID=UPI00352AFACC
MTKLASHRGSWGCKQCTLPARISQGAKQPRESGSLRAHLSTFAPGRQARDPNFLCSGEKEAKELDFFGAQEARQLGSPPTYLTTMSANGDCKQPGSTRTDQAAWNQKVMSNLAAHQSMPITSWSTFSGRGEKLITVLFKPFTELKTFSRSPLSVFFSRMRPTAWGNHSTVTQFTFLGFSHHRHTQVILCVLFFLIYTITLMGNSLIILITVLDSALHTPMYFFLCNLSFLEICYTSVTLPKMLLNFVSEEKTISFSGCAIQMYFLIFLGTAECYLLAAMAYDRYRAICSPLHYPVIMNPTACAQMVAACWICGILMPLGNVSWIFSLSYCEINHFFCDIHPVLKLACGDTSRIEVSILFISMSIIIFPCLLVLVSYARILSTVLKTTSPDGRSKAFSTCSSHLTVVILFYGSTCAMYLRPKSSHVGDVDRVMALVYTVFTPILNPLVYSLRNKDVKEALRRLRRRKIFS